MLVQKFCDILNEGGIDFFCGVPDSLLKNFCAYIAEHIPRENNIITANEGNAIALASGYFLATRKPALVYMQNSGLGNCVNPLLSLTDKDVYNIPMLLVIGLRGEKGIKDEPQHFKQGILTEALLKTMNIKYSILPDNLEQTSEIINKSFDYMSKTNNVYALIVRKNYFEKYESKRKLNNYTLSREKAIEIVAKNTRKNDVLVATTGHISRELYQYRKNINASHKSDFLTVGSMGHASSIALGIAIKKRNRNIVCLDGDGAAIMHLGSMPVISSLNLDNFKHIIFNNESHNSVGGQPTVSNIINFKQLAKSLGYDEAYSVSDENELKKIMSKFLSSKRTSLLEIKVKNRTDENLIRPLETPIENKNIFMDYLDDNKTIFTNDAISKLKKELQISNAKNILFFASKSVLNNKKIQSEIKTKLLEFNIDYYTDFSVNAKAQEVSIAIKKLKNKYDTIIALGGGSVIDFAKLFKFAYDNKVSIEKYIQGYSKTIKDNTNLIAIPTTAGTGSEATQFAVVYINNKKYSLEHYTILPKISILSTKFLTKLPKHIKSSTAMDAFCQALESYWSVNSTAESISYSLKAIKLCHKYLIDYVVVGDLKATSKILIASNLAGKAINIAKTTASHALSYTISTKYNLSHGHTVALSIAKLFQYNCNINEKNIADTRGLEYVTKKMQKLLLILDIKNIDSINNYFNNMFADIELESNITKLGINDIKNIAASVNLQRMKNNPRLLSKEDLNNMFNY